MTERRKSPDDRSLHTKIVEYFDAFPDEELTRNDIALKFDVHPNTVDRVLRVILAQGELESVKLIRRRPRVRTAGAFADERSLEAA